MFLIIFFPIVTAVTTETAAFFHFGDDGALQSHRIPLNDIIRRAQKPISSTLQTSENQDKERVKLQLYYECLCPDCREFDTTQFKETVVKLDTYLDVHIYPYGNANTIEKNNHTEFVCQHGPEECYGNKLHACAIDDLNNMTRAIIYNSCMMDYSQAGNGSDDVAADACAHHLEISSDPIKECAKGDKGTQLLKHYGEESQKADINDVPYLLINGVKNDGAYFIQDVCRAFKNPPAACNDFNS